MRKEEIRVTPTWELYEKGRNFHHMAGIYTDSQRNYRMYNGNQWEGAKFGDIEPIQDNFIKPVVKYKVAVIHDNLYSIHYDSQNFESNEFQKTAVECCKMLNRYAARIWEQDKMDFKGRRVTKDAAINDEGIIYVDFDLKRMVPVNEIIKKCDIYYGNENEEDIQRQPYILIRKRVSVSEAEEMAREAGASEEEISLIVGDKDTFEQSGEASKLELDDNVTLITKLYKKDGTVHSSTTAKLCEIVKEFDTGLSLYPVAHLNWEEREGSARGEGEVRHLIPNQIEVNRIEFRRLLTVKQQSFPQKVVLKDRISNYSAVNAVGGVINVQGQTVDDVNKIISVLKPAQMSPDVVKLRDDLIQLSRDLAGAGDSATGQINPETTSGKAILAVQRASQAPMTEQRESFKNFVEDIARIWLEYIIVHSANGINLERVEIDPDTGRETVRIVLVPQITLKQLQATVKIEVTPKSVYDKFAQEQALEALFTGGYLNVQRLGEFKVFVDALDDDSYMPKQKLLRIIEKMEGEQVKIARIEAQGKLLHQKQMQFLEDDPDGQAEQIANAQMKQRMQQLMRQKIQQQNKEVI